MKADVNKRIVNKRPIMYHKKVITKIMVNVVLKLDRISQNNDRP